jgi:hypothetical protein
MPKTATVNSKDDDDDKVVKDGYSLRVPVYLMDATQKAIAGGDDKSVILDHHRPGFRLSDADQQRRRELYDRRDAELSDAWKAPLSDPAAVKEAAPIKVVDYASYDRRISEAWRSA